MRLELLVFAGSLVSALLQMWVSRCRKVSNDHHNQFRVPQLQTIVDKLILAMVTSDNYLELKGYFVNHRRAVHVLDRKLCVCMTEGDFKEAFTKIYSGENNKLVDEDRVEEWIHRNMKGQLDQASLAHERARELSRYDLLLNFKVDLFHERLIQLQVLVSAAVLADAVAWREEVAGLQSFLAEQKGILIALLSINFLQYLLLLWRHWKIGVKGKADTQGVMATYSEQVWAKIELLVDCLAAGFVLKWLLELEEGQFNSQFSLANQWMIADCVAMVLKHPIFYLQRRALEGEKLSLDIRTVHNLQRRALRSEEQSRLRQENYRDKPVF
mmetsp:Transcript_11942/g.20178  ORF Transcript_11942/g.20178 Transcript_11942/m.20178 type:complete len:327 (+) Transcript_11942:516-1496(+)